MMNPFSSSASRVTEEKAYASFINFQRAGFQADHVEF